MHYFTRALDIACCENDAHRARLVAQGFVECDVATFRAAWQERDRERRLALAVHDERMAAQRDRARIVGALPGVVYPREER